MANKEYTQIALKNYKIFCNLLDKKKWKYKRNDEKIRIEFSISNPRQANSLPIKFSVNFNDGLGVCEVYAILNIGDIPENRRSLMAGAVLIANSRIRYGRFDYDCLRNNFLFGVTACFIDSELNELLYDSMIITAYNTARAYYDKFITVSKAQNMSTEQLLRLFN